MKPPLQQTNKVAGQAVGIAPAKLSTHYAAQRAEKNYFIQKPPEIAQVPDFGENGPKPFL